jgi:hypothetical protein
MKVLLLLRSVTITVAAVLLSSGCQKESVVRNPDSQRNNELHENTKPLQGADLVGYNGTKLRKSVDKIKQDNDKHSQELEKAAEDQ